MPLRILSLILMSAVLAGAAPSKVSKEKKPAKQARSWKTLIDHVVKNGDDDPIEGSTAKTLGYDSDNVYAKSLGIDADKSRDKREHGIYVVCDKSEKGDLIPKEIVLGAIKVKQVDSEKEIDGYRVRMTLDGAIIRGMHATGLVGHVAHEILQKDSKTLQAVYKSESALYLKELDLAQLTK